VNVIWLAALLLGSAFAIAGGPGVKRKLLNVAVILACMGVGLGLGYAAGLGSKNLGRIPNAAVPFSMMFGVAGALGCVWLNKGRED
jgi:hypothetical protein